MRSHNSDLRLRGAHTNIFSSTTLVQAQNFLILKNRFIVIIFDFWFRENSSCLYITYFFIFTCIIPRGAPFAGGAPLLGGEGPPCGGPGCAPAAGGGGAALFSGAGGGPAPLKGKSHEIDFKNFQNLAAGAALFSGAGGPAPLKGLSQELDVKNFEEKKLTELGLQHTEWNHNVCNRQHYIKFKLRLKLITMKTKNSFILRKIYINNVSNTGTVYLKK